MTARDKLDAYARRTHAGLSHEQHAPHAIAALRRVLKLHPRDDDDNCVVCWDVEGNWPLAYPCDTVQAIVRALDGGGPSGGEA